MTHQSNQCTSITEIKIKKKAMIWPLHWNQCDQIAKLSFNVGPFTTITICPVS